MSTSNYYQKKIKDPELSKFYHDLMICEAGHYTTFIGFARKYRKDIDIYRRWKELVEFKGELNKSYGKHETISWIKKLNQNFD